MAELTKYQRRLVSLVGAEPDLYKARKYFIRFDDNLDAIYRTIAEKLDDEGPQFSIKLAEELAEIIFSNSNLSSQITTRKEWIEDRYGIKVISLGDAIRESYGEYDNLNYGRVGKAKRFHSGSNILYRNSDSLVEFIKKNTTRRETVVIDMKFK